MTTPAENTRYKVARTLKSAASRREERQVLKENQFAQNVAVKNELVKVWLLASDQIVSKNVKTKVNQTEVCLGSSRVQRKHTQLLKQIDKRPSCEMASDKLEISFKDKNAMELQSENCLEAKSLNTAWSKQNEAEEEESVPFGHSAMSGRSSTARRRASRQSKMQEMAAKHAKGDAVKKKKVIEKRTSGEWSDQTEHDQSIKAALTTTDCQSEITHPYNEGANRNDNQAKHDMSVDSRSESPKYGSEILTGNNSQTPVTKSKEEDADETENNHSTVPESQKSSKVPEEEDQLDLDMQVIEDFQDRLKQEDKTVFYDMFELIITKLATV